MKKLLSVLSNIILYLPNIALAAFFMLMFIGSIITPTTPTMFWSGIIALAIAVCTIAGMLSGKWFLKVLLAWLGPALLTFGTIACVAGDGIKDRGVLAVLLIVIGLFILTLVCTLIAMPLRLAARNPRLSLIPHFLAHEMTMAFSDHFLAHGLSVHRNSW